MPYADYDVSMYRAGAPGASTAGINSIRQFAYDPRAAQGTIGGPAAAPCPVGGATAQPIGQCISGTIPTHSGGVTGDQLSDIMKQAYLDTQKQSQVTAFDMPCCPNPPPCQECVAWRNTFKNCPVTYASDPAMQCEVNPVGDRYMVGDLDPLKYERSIAQEAQWNPYLFLDARRSWMSYLMSDMVTYTRSNDPYTKVIPNLDSSFCMQQNLRGPPAYTTF